MLWYLVARTARRIEGLGVDFQSDAQLVRADSQAKAEERALELALEFWDPRHGWAYHEVSATPIPRDVFDHIASDYGYEYVGNGEE